MSAEPERKCSNSQASAFIIPFLENLVKEKWELQNKGKFP